MGSGGQHHDTALRKHDLRAMILRTAARYHWLHNLTGVRALVRVASIGVNSPTVSGCSRTVGDIVHHAPRDTA
jgi:hypothetical protein